MSTSTSRGYKKAVPDVDVLATYVGTDLAATLDLLDADVTAALAAAGGALNQLVNGGFEVHQRGGTVTATNAYAHDRWQLILAGTSTATVTDETTIVDTGSGHAAKVVYVHNTASRIDQKLEQYLQMRGRTLSLSFRAHQSVASGWVPYIEDSGTRTYGTTTTTTGAFVTKTVSLAIGSGATSVRAGVEFRASGTFYLDNAMLVVGASPVDFVPTPPADGLDRCQRYYQEIGGLSLFEPFGVGANASTTVGEIHVRLPVEMVAAPTVTVSAAGDFTLLGADGTQKTATAVSVNQATRRSLRLLVTVAAGLTAGGGTAMLANNTLAARLKIEANP